MALPRVQLFEFNDAAWVPASLRETIVLALSQTLRLGRMLDGLVEPFARFLDAAGTREVLDLCAGAGGPAAILSAALREQGLEAHFLLSDLTPHVALWRALVDASGGRLALCAAPVDATAIPPELGRGRARLMVNALHHFPPALAKQVLAGACAGAPGVFIAEGLDRNPLSFAAMGPFGLAGLLSTPLVARHRLQSMLWTWLTPVALVASLWDGTVSSLRAYSEAELRELVSGISGWRWAFGTYTHNGLGRGSWFAGLPVREQGGEVPADPAPSDPV